jgi:hypothetical protein
LAPEPAPAHGDLKRLLLPGASVNAHTLTRRLF